MKTRIAAVVLALTACGCALLAEDEDNLIKDPDFKELNKTWRMNAGSTVKNGIATVPLTTPRKKDPNTFTASVVQSVSGIKPGKYEFSGYYKGEFKNLFIVLRGYTQDRKAVNIILKWLYRKNFVKAGDKPGWFKFFYVGTVPAGVVRASIHIEPWGSKDQTMQLTGLELAEAE